MLIIFLAYITDSNLRTLSIMSFTDDGFLATLFMDKNLPIMNTL